MEYDQSEHLFSLRPRRNNKNGIHPKRDECRLLASVVPPRLGQDRLTLCMITGASPGSATMSDDQTTKLSDDLTTFTLQLEGPFGVVVSGRLSSSLPALCTDVQHVLILFTAFAISDDYKTRDIIVNVF